ncbi:MAG: hypothetical protein ABIQ35_00060 [Verrucomicrobiota bacterium]
MKQNLIKIIIACALFWSGTLATRSLRAEDKPVALAEAKKDRPIPFKGKINEIDKTAKTIGIGKDKKRTIHITDKTKFVKGGKTWDQAAVGDDVGGSYRADATGKLEAVSLRIGLKPEVEPKVKVESKKKKE